MQELKKQYKSIAAIPVKVEMQPVEHKSESVLTIDELQQQIEEARKGKAKVDNQYVNYNEAGHLFDYNFDYARFLENIAYIIKEAKSRPDDKRYKNRLETIIQ